MSKILSYWGILCGKNTTMKNKDTGSPLSQTEWQILYERDVGKIFQKVREMF